MKRQGGFLLMPVVFCIALLALMALALNEQARSNMAGAASEYNIESSQRLAAAGVVQARWLAMNNRCNVPDSFNQQSPALGSYAVNYSGTAAAMTIDVQATGPGGTQVARKVVGERIFDYANMREVAITASEDTYIQGKYNQVNNRNGNDVELKVGSKSNAVERALVQFDLTSIPDGARVQSAELHLYQSSQGDNENLGIYQVTDNWREDQTTWYRPDSYRSWSPAGGSYSPNKISEMSVGASEGWKIADVSSAAKTWVHKEGPNYGLILKGLGNNKNSKEFSASEYPNAVERPKLLLRIYCPCGASCNMGEPIDDVILTTEENNNSLGAQSFSNKDLVRKMPRKSDVVDLLLLGQNFGITQKINALHILESGHLLLAFADAGTVNGTSFEPEDIIELNLDSGETRLRLDGSALGLNRAITALTIDLNGDLLLALEDDGNWRGQAFSDGDILRYSFASHQVSKVLDASDMGYDEEVSGMYRRSNGHYLMTFKRDIHWQGFAYKKGDILSIDPGTNAITLYFSRQMLEKQKRITALHVGKGRGKLPLQAQAHWAMASSSGNVVEELIANNDGQRFGGQWTAGAKDGALSLNGSSDYVAVNHSDNLAPDASFSVAAYVKWQSLIGPQTIVSKQSNGQVHYALALASGLAEFRIGDVTAVALLPLQLDEWAHVAGVYDADAQEMQIYINGELGGSASFANDLPSVNASAAVHLGSNGNADYLNGALDDVRLYNQAISADDIADLLVNVGPPVYDDGPIYSPAVCVGSYVDKFNNRNGEGNNGSLSWSNSWQEFGDDGQLKNGDVAIASGYLRLRNNNRGMWRRADMSGASSTAKLHLTYRREFLSSSSTYVSIEISPLGEAGPYTEVVRLKGFAFDVNPRSSSYDIGAMVGPDTVIRVKTSNNLPNSQQVRIYKITLSCDDS